MDSAVDIIDHKLDELRTELMLIISSSRDQKEISEKIYEVMSKYPQMQDIPNLIASLNSIISTDLKNVKDTLIKAIDTLIAIKKLSLKQQRNMETHLHTLQKDFELLKKDFNSFTETSGEHSNLETGIINILGSKIPLVHLVWAIISIFAVIFVSFAINPNAAKQTTEAIGVTIDKTKDK